MCSMRASNSSAGIPAQTARSRKAIADFARSTRGSSVWEREESVAAMVDIYLDLSLVRTQSRGPRARRQSGKPLSRVRQSLTAGTIGRMGARIFDRCGLSSEGPLKGGRCRFANRWVRVPQIYLNRDSVAGPNCAEQHSRRSNPETRKGERYSASHAERTVTLALDLSSQEDVSLRSRHTER